MRIDQIMSPREAAIWWRYHGNWQKGGGVYDRVHKPKYGTPQEKYRCDKQVSMVKVVKRSHVNNMTILAFEKGDLKKASEVSWLRLAYFYGRHILPVNVIKKGKWFALYERWMGEYADEPLHRRVRMAARETTREYQRHLRKLARKKESEMPNHPVQWYKQGRIVRGGIY